MGLDLRLLPFDGTDFSHTVLDCDRNYNLFDSIRGLPLLAIEGRFATFVGGRTESGEQRYGDTQEDEYGETVRWTHAVELLKFNKLACTTPRNRAIWFYLAALPPKTRVALYWH